MAVEARRGCGYRKIGGLYLVSEGVGYDCSKLPFELTVCPCCGEGVKQTRGWTWINPQKLFASVTEKRNPDGVDSCPYRWCRNCPVSNPPERAGLTWIGTQFYPTPSDWIKEGKRLGVSRRISAIPRGLKLGEDWVFVAHPKACMKEEIDEILDTFDGRRGLGDLATGKLVPAPGIFHAFKPTRIEMIVGDDQAQDFDFMESLEKRGITPVIVPHDDPDHQGTCYDKAEKEEALL